MRACPKCKRIRVPGSSGTRDAVVDTELGGEVHAHCIGCGFRWITDGDDVVELLAIRQPPDEEAEQRPQMPEIVPEPELPEIEAADGVPEIEAADGDAGAVWRAD